MSLGRSILNSSMAALVLTGAVVGQVVESLSSSTPDPFRSQSSAGDSLSPLFRAGGRFIVFASSADNLVPADGNGPLVYDVFRQDLVTGETLLISVAVADAGGSSGSNGSSTPLDVSTDGNRILFASVASNLVAGDTNRVSDLFVRDVPHGTTHWITVGPDGRTPSDVPVFSGSMSGLVEAGTGSGIRRPPGKVFSMCRIAFTDRLSHDRSINK